MHISKYWLYLFFQVRMSVGGERFTVDVLPTIGLEVYDDADRVPRRDSRGSPQQVRVIN